MKRISRNIVYTHTPWGDNYYLYKHGHSQGRYMTLEHVLMARKEQDFEKGSWNKTDEIIPKKFKSDVMYHYPTGKYYVELKLNHYEILVSDLYKTKKDAQEIQKYLDKERWNVEALNLQKKIGLDCCREYTGILPTKEGYVIVDADNNQHGKTDDLDEALRMRNHLRERGVII